MHRGGSRTPDIDKRVVRLQLYAPHPGQRALHSSPARFRVVVCGRRWGKTLAGVNEIAKYGWEHGPLEPPSWWVAPTYGQSAKAFTTVTTQLKTAVKSATSAAGQMKVRWKSGSITEFKSAERWDNLRGEGVGLMIVDEAAFVAEEAWNKVLRPMLSDTNGRALLIGTPKGKNWFYKMYSRGEDELQADYAAFHFPTSSSPYIPAEEVIEAQQTLPADVYAQEYEAAFLDEAAGVFHGIAECEDGNLGDFAVPEPGHRYVIGWDIAKHTDFSVVTVLDTDAQREGRSVNRIVSFERFNQINYNFQLDMVEATARKWNTYVLMDSTGLGDPLYDALTGRGVPAFGYHFTSLSKQQLIQNLAVDIQNGDVIFPAIPELRHELEAYEYEISGHGTLRYGAPDGMHDDCVTSLALAEWAARHPAWMNHPVFTLEDDEQISPY